MICFWFFHFYFDRSHRQMPVYGGQVQSILCQRLRINVMIEKKFASRILFLKQKILQMSKIKSIKESGWNSKYLSVHSEYPTLHLPCVVIWTKKTLNFSFRSNHNSCTGTTFFNSIVPAPIGKAARVLLSYIPLIGHVE